MINSNPIVSIIVPIYGTELFLASCIDSLCKQTYPYLQIILVDDQSPDRCPEICDYYAQRDKRIVVVHQMNKGVSGARNTGLSIATGDYVMFVDSDDELYLNAVECLLDDSILYNADIVSAAYKMFDQKRGVIFENGDGLTSVFCNDMPLLLSLKGDRNTEAVWAKLFKREFIDGIYFVEGKNINEDSFFLFECFINNPVLVQHNVLVYRYNIRNDSSSRLSFSEKYLAMLYFMERKKRYLFEYYPQYLNHGFNMEVRTYLSFLDLLCSTKEKKYKLLQKQCINKVRKLIKYHNPINKHHKQLSWIVVCGLYPIYKILIRLKYY